MPQLTSARLLLRKPTMNDTQALFDIYGDPATNLHNPYGPYPSLAYAADRMNAWLQGWETDGIGQWAVEKRDDPGNIIGFGGLSSKDYGGELRLNLGYRFAASAWGQGYASETAREALRCAFGPLDAPAVYGMVRPSNLPSIHVLSKQGFRLAGQLEDIAGQPPSLIFLLRREDYLE